MLKRAVFTIPIVVLGLFAFTASKARATPDINRISGMDRYETAAAIAMDGWQKSDYAVLVYGENYPDALSAAPLAKKYDAPILLTDKDRLNQKAKEALYDLKVSNVMIVGGFGVVSEAVEGSIKDTGINVVRIAGRDRYETSVKVAEHLGEEDKIIVASGEDYADALSIAPIAAKLRMPVILVPRDGLTEEISAYIHSKPISKTYIMGDSDIISNDVAGQFYNIERITGSNKYERNISAILRFDQEYDYKTICIATGRDYADALSGSVYAAKSSAPVILLNNPPSAISKSFINSKISLMGNMVIFGGNGAITNLSVMDILSETQEYIACLKESVEIKEEMAELYKDLEEHRIIDLDFKDNLKDIAKRIDGLIPSLEELKSSSPYTEFAERLINVWKERKEINSQLTEAIEKQEYGKVTDLDNQRVQCDLNEHIAISSLISQSKKQNESMLKGLLNEILSLNLPQNKSFSIISREIKRKSQMTVSDMTFMVGKEAISIFDDEEKIVQILGQPQKVDTLTDKDTSLYKRKYIYEGVSIVASEGYGLWYIESIKATSKQYMTLRGLKVGDTEERLIELYGDSDEFDSKYDYSALEDKPIAMEVILRDGVVAEILMSY